MGQVIGGQYKLVEELGSDSVFDLFRAEDSAATKQFFVRGISSTEPRSENFARQIHGLILKLKSVNYPGVERLLGAHQESNGFYLVSQYSPGSVLESRLKRLSSLSVPAAVAMAIDLCEGLVALHGAEIVHGDISPRTVLSTSNDGAKLLLPGMWRAYSQDHNLAVTVHSQMAPYLAPEVSAGDMPSAQSDIYSLGVLLWQVLVGRVPFYGDGPTEIAEKHANEPYPSLRMVAATVPMALDEIIKKCLDKNPLKRYGSAQSLLSDLTAVQDALRFGRKITWPIQGAVSTAEIADVAPTLNAVDGEPMGEKQQRKQKEKNKKIREKSDGIPAWLAWLFYVVSAMCMVFIGAWIFLNAQKPKTIVVPNIVGMQVEDARADLKKFGLKLREVRRDPSEDYAEGQIIETDPTPTSEIREGGRVEAIVSRGSKFVQVPDFRGLTVEAARKLAESANLPINDTEIDLVRDKELEEGLIVSQIPEARKKVERFTKIRLKVSNGNKRIGSTRNADWHTNRVKMSIPTDVGKDDVLVRIDITDDQGTKTLFEELMVPGQEIDERVRWVGDELIIRIFFDGELVKQLNEKPAKSEEE